MKDMSSPIGHFENPFRPGAGHMPPYLAGRQHEREQFLSLLRQTVVTDNLVLTGLRGVGKTVLLESFKPIAVDSGWLWVGTDLSESTSLTDDSIVIRLLTDIASATTGITATTKRPRPGLRSAMDTVKENPLTFDRLVGLYQATPGLPQDKLKAVLDQVWGIVKMTGAKGILFAYDEAQNLTDHADRDQFPLSLVLDVFQSAQRRNFPFLLVLTGLPTLFTKLVESRTYSERMFQVLHLDKLNDEESREAIVKPIEAADCPVRLHDDLINDIVRTSGGYPYFIQFICREVFDIAIARHKAGTDLIVSLSDITRKLDQNFFAGRWNRATDRQRDLLFAIASLDDADGEFAVQEVVESSKRVLQRGFNASHVSQMLAKLVDDGLVYKDRHGKYLFAVPLFAQFVRRQKAGLQVIDGI